MSAHALDIVSGSDGAGNGLMVRSRERGELVERLGPHVIRTRVANWDRVVVRTMAHGSPMRAWVLEPGEHENAIRHGVFSVVGMFRVIEKTRNDREALSMWKGTEAA